jgi:hypothetical protein
LTQQILTADGYGEAYVGLLNSWSNTLPVTTVTLHDEPTWIGTGATNPQTLIIAIVAGTGAGQYSFISGYSNSKFSSTVNAQCIPSSNMTSPIESRPAVWTVCLATPWSVSPDANSVIDIVSVLANVTIANNKFTGTLGMTMNIQGFVDTDIEGNQLIDSGQGMAFTGGDYFINHLPEINTDVLRNSFMNGSGTYMNASYNGSGGNQYGGIGLAAGGGEPLAGIMIRDNTLPSLQSIYPTNLPYHMTVIGANLIEGNSATWHFYDVENQSLLYDQGFYVFHNFNPTN